MLNMSKNFLSAAKDERRLMSANTKMLNPRSRANNFVATVNPRNTKSIKSMSMIGMEDLRVSGINGAPFSTSKLRTIDDTQEVRL
jgi:hypothetical protein